MNERKARALIDQHFVESLSPRKRRKLQEHLSACEEIGRASCRERV